MTRNESDPLGSALDFAPTGIAVVSGAGRLRWANRRLCRMLRRGFDELVGIPLDDLLHPDDAAPPVSSPVDLAPGEMRERGRRRFRRPDGTFVWGAVSLTRLPDEGGEPVGVVHVADLSQLVQAEERLSLVVDRLHDGVLVIDPAGRVTSANPTAVALFSGDRLVGRHLHDPGWCLVDDRGEPLAAELRPELRALASGLPAEGVVGIRRPDETRWVAVSAQPLERSGGRRHVVATYEDVSERRRVEAALHTAEARFRELLDHAPDAVLVVDADGRIAECNRRSEVLFGYAPGQLVGRRAEELVPGIVDETAPTPGWERTGRRRDGSELPVEVSLGNLDSPDGPTVLAIVRDLTERRRAEEALRADRAKSEFLSRMSHELRTPLNSVLGFAQLLRMGELDPHQTEAVEQILGAGRHLLGLLDEVLDLERIETGRLEVELRPVRAATVLHEAVELVQPLAAASGIAVDLRVSDLADHHVLADRQRFRQVLLNLLTNAVKYNRRHGRVEVTCVVRTDALVLRVHDTGPGIPVEKLDRLFTPFERLGAEHLGIEGTGVGLALSKRLTEAMGGAIGAEPGPGGGSLFWVMLRTCDPARPARTDAAAPIDPTGLGDLVAEPDRPPRRVLYVEDNDANRRLMEQLAHRHGGFELLTSTRGFDGVALAQATGPDVVLLDLNLPDCPGEDVLLQLRRDPRTRDTPVIVLSADAMPERVARLTAAGATAYLLKPIDVSELFAALETALHDPRP